MTASPLLSDVNVTPAAGALITATIANVNDDLIVPCLGASQVLLTLLATTLVGGTITVAGSMDAGVTYSSMTFQAGFGGSTGTNMPISTAFSLIPCAGLSHVRCRLTAVTSGSATAAGRAVYGAVNAVGIDGGSITSIASAVTPGTTAGNLGKAEDAVHASGDVGVFALAVRQDSPGAAFASANGDYSPFAVDNIGSQLVRFLPSASSALVYCALSHLVSAVGINATVASATQAVMHNGIFTNTTATMKFMKFFNKTTTPVPGTDTPIISFGIPPNGTVVLNADLVPLRFSIGLSYAITGAAADLDNTSVAAGDVISNIWYV